MSEDLRYLPSVIPPPQFNSPDREPAGVLLDFSGKYVSIHTEDGEMEPLDFIRWIVGKTVYTTVPFRGYFDTILRFLPVKVLESLAAIGIATWKGYELFLYGRDGYLIIRNGNKWGSFSNIKALYDGPSSPKAIRLTVELAQEIFARYGFYEVDFRSVGKVVEDIAFKAATYQPRPELDHLDMHYQSFKGARMEAVTMGASDVYDYDIRAAYPSFVADLPSTQGMEWTSGTEMPESAYFGAALCDVYINDRLVRGPIAVRHGEHSVYFPVGHLTGVWLNKPDLDLLKEFPELGHVERIHEASWGIPTTNWFPYRRVMRRLYGLREREPFVAPYVKLVMAGFWGKFVSKYTQIKSMETGEGWTQSSAMFNPVYGAHITSAMRTHLYRLTLGSNVIGEFVDGFASTDRFATDKRKRFGSLSMKGAGQMFLFNDSIKACTWKNPELIDMAFEQRDEYKLTIPSQYYHTLASSYARYGATSMQRHIGEDSSSGQQFRLGSSMRFMGNDKLRVGDFLDGKVVSHPPIMNEMKAFRFMRAVDGSQ